MEIALGGYVNQDTCSQRFGDPPPTAGPLHLWNYCESGLGFLSRDNHPPPLSNVAIAAKTQTNYCIR